MAIVAKFKLTERLSRAGWAFSEGHFAEGSPCRHGVSYNPDANPDIIDRITGHIRNRQDAPEEDGDSHQNRSHGDSVGTDPLRGL